MVTKGSAWNLFILLVGMSLFLLPLTIGDAAAEKICFVSYKDFFYVSPGSKMVKKEHGCASARDYRHYGEEQREDWQGGPSGLGGEYKGDPVSGTSLNTRTRVHDSPEQTA